MTIYKDAYQTTIGKMYSSSIKKTERNIKEAIIKDGINRVSLNLDNNKTYKPFFILGNNVSESNIEIFSHPLLLSYQNENYLCTDLRPYVKKDTTSENIENNIRNLSEYNFCKSRTVLNLIWVNDNPSILRNLFSFAGTVFTVWISETISKTLNLDFNQKSIISAITSFYYQSLFFDNSTLTEDQKMLMVKNAAKITNIPVNNLFSLLDKIDQLDNLDDYCKTIVKLVDNVRLEKFNLAMLLTIISSSWYGTNAKENISVALEHPPTWIAIVYTALTDRTYKKSTLSNFCENLSKRGAGEEFTKNFISLISDNLISTDNGEKIILDRSN